MLDVNPYAEHVSACLLDYFGDTAPWQRRLWTVGSLLALREILEGSEAVQSSVLHSKSFEYLCRTVEAVAGQDPGIGDEAERRLLQKVLRSELRAGGSDYLSLRQMLPGIESSYLERWSRALAVPGPQSPSPERAARSIAAHLLDAGFSGAFLHRWWRFKIHYYAQLQSLSQIVAEAHHQLVLQPPAEFEILVAFEQAPQPGDLRPEGWRTAAEVSKWLRNNDFDPRGVRQAGGLLFRPQARDVHSAVERVLEAIDRLIARVHLGTPSRLTFLPHVWVRGEAGPFALRRRGRGVEVGALARENQLYMDSGTSSVDAALELLGPLNDGPPGPAVAGSWAAIEALLLGPGDAGDRGVAGDRLAALVASSYPRAELTTLAYAHSRNVDDLLTQEIQAAPHNRARAEILAQALRAGQPLALTSDSDRLAERRIRELLAAPRPFLREVEQQISRTLRRLYRQRNLVLHWGRMNAVSLQATLRTAAPLVGAGVDRIAHAWFLFQTNPLELAARARIRLELLGSTAGSSPLDLLEP